MKKLFLVVVLIVVTVVSADYVVSHKDDGQSYLEQLKHTMECADWMSHHNADYGYEMRYLSCFQPEGVGNGDVVRYVYVEEVSALQSIHYITQEVHAEVRSDSLTPRAEMQKRAKALGGIYLERPDGSFLMSGSLVSDDKYVTAYRYDAKYVLRQQLWFVHVVIYPEDFAPAMERLIEEVNAWEPFPQ